ncbi:MAG: hypothetical protein JWM11_4481 [Planctomycetaceae bacterium]|nr:hypothetical protein [Planctomycetaceae bacterium]
MWKRDFLVVLLMAADLSGVIRTLLICGSRLGTGLDGFECFGS